MKASIAHFLSPDGWRVRLRLSGHPDVLMAPAEASEVGLALLNAAAAADIEGAKLSPTERCDLCGGTGAHMAACPLVPKLGRGHG